jgi:hypothetical protein
MRKTCVSLLLRPLSPKRVAYGGGGKNVKQMHKWLCHATPAFTLERYVYLLASGLSAADFFDWGQVPARLRGQGSQALVMVARPDRTVSGLSSASARYSGCRPRFTGEKVPNEQRVLVARPLNDREPV